MKAPKTSRTLVGKWVESLQKRSLERDYTFFSELLDLDPLADLLDLGCGEGARTIQFAERIGTKNVTGLEVRDWHPSFNLIVGNINEGLPFPDSSFDVVTASHIIEHVPDTDLFTQETYRVLRPGGYTLIATPNMAGAKTIVSLLLNRQPVDAHTSDFFLPREFPNEEWERWWMKYHSGGSHRRLFTLSGLTHLLTYYRFEIEKAVNDGYGPFVFAKVLLRGLYAANLIVKARKPCK